MPSNNNSFELGENNRRGFSLLLSLSEQFHCLIIEVGIVRVLVWTVINVAGMISSNEHHNVILITSPKHRHNATKVDNDIK